LQVITTNIRYLVFDDECNDSLYFQDINKDRRKILLVNLHGLGQDVGRKKDSLRWRRFYISQDI